MANYSVVGHSVYRTDANPKVTGQALHVGNIEMPGMLHVAVLRSPYPHARIKRIDASKAEKVAGVVAVITRDDILHDEGIEPFYGPVFKDQTIVAVEKARHVGDPVAAVAALTVDAAEEALGLIDIDYEELPAVLDVGAALDSKAALVHDSVKLPTSGFADLAEIKPVDGTNICTHFKLQRGDIQKGFAEAERIPGDARRSLELPAPAPAARRAGQPRPGTLGDRPGGHFPARARLAAGPAAARGPGHAPAGRAGGRRCHGPMLAAHLYRSRGLPGLPRPLWLGRASRLC